MSKRIHAVLFKTSVFAWIALAVAAVLLVPFIAMRFTAEVLWDQTDFITMGSLLFGSASLCVMTMRRASRNRRALVLVTFLGAFLYIWAELAVGVFTKVGS
jgi:hypothetical protein